jgi:hypothetical protein
MGHRYIVPYVYRGFPVSAMHDHTVLDIDVVPDPDIMHIAPDDGIEPDAAIIPYDHIPDNC